MKNKVLIGVLLLTVFLTACGGYAAYKLAVDSQFASKAVARLDIKDENTIYRIQTDSSGIHAATINKNGDIVEDQLFVTATTWNKWDNVESANAGQYFIYP